MEPSPYAESASAYAYEFDFVGAFSDDVYGKCTTQTPELLQAVQNTCTQLAYVLSLPASSGLKNISMPVLCNDTMYKVRLSRT